MILSKYSWVKLINGFFSLKIVETSETRRVSLKVVVFLHRCIIWFRVIGWISSKEWTAKSKWKMKFPRGSFSKIGLIAKTLDWACGFELMILLLKSKSMMSENGYNPVPPATMMILPGLVEVNLRPSPLGSLRYSLLKDLLRSFGSETSWRIQFYKKRDIAPQLLKLALWLSTYRICIWRLVDVF